MKTAILILLVGILPLNIAFPQERPSYPRWSCQPNSHIKNNLRAVITDEGFSCWAQCEDPIDFPDTWRAPEGDERIHACLDSTRFPQTGLGQAACSESLGVPAQCLPSSSGGGGSDNSTKALIAGGVAIAAVAVVKYLAPETPEGVNIRPKANIAFRDGMAVSTAGLLADCGIGRLPPFPPTPERDGRNPTPVFSGLGFFKKRRPPMKTAILILLVGILPLNIAFPQERPSYPRWSCQHNSLIKNNLRAVITDEGFSCWAQCEDPIDFPDTWRPPEGDGRIHACVGQVLTDDIGLDTVACSESLGTPAQCLPSSGGGGGSDNSTKALIAGGVAIAAVAVVKYLAPETPEGVNIRPKANIAFRDGVAVSTAGLLADWRNWEVAAVSANAGQGWTKPYARVQWTWVF